MNLFYTPDLENETNTYTLNKEESKHAIKVLRLTVDKNIILTNGKGLFCIAKITDDNQKKCVVKIIDKKTNYKKQNYHLHLAVAPTKLNDRFEWFLEKSTEIGINEITPIICQNSERKIIKKERYEKIILSAVKQSLKAYIPKINDPIPFKKFITTHFEMQKYIAHCEHNQNKKYLKEIILPNEKYLIMIGPEGDFSKEEIEIAMQNEFVPISLGTNRLRTETAGIVVCHAVNFINQ